MTQTTVRSRPRALDVTNQPEPANQSQPQPGQVTRQIIDKAKQAFVARLEKNKAARDEKKASKDLEQLMTDQEVSNFSFRVQHDNKTYPVTVTIAPGSRSVIDVAMLKNLVDEETFLRIVSASQTAVQEHAGSAILAQVVADKETPPSLSLKEDK